MPISFQVLESVDDISFSEFNKKYSKRPVILKKLSDSWSAPSKWSPRYLKSILKGKKVPLYDSSKVNYSKKVNEPVNYMSFESYIDLITSKPTDLRIFLYNIFEHAPNLCLDFTTPNLMNGFLDKYPMMFFGGKGSQVFLHYDLDMSHVFHTQIFGRKKVYLFSPKYSKQLYKLPFAVHNIEEINLERPNYHSFPALNQVQGFECTLTPGDTLFMPSGWWHFMKYLDGGYALSQRAFPTDFPTRLQSIYNLTIMRKFDNLCRKMLGQNWLDWKYKKAVIHANT